MGFGFLFFLSSFLIVVGLLGLLFTRKNLITILMCFELILAGINLVFAICALSLDDIVGLLFVFFILTVAAAESAIGLAIMVSYFRVKGLLFIEYLSTIKQ